MGLEIAYNHEWARRNIASGVRSWNCAGQGAASKQVPEAPDGCALRHCSRGFRICQSKRGLRGSDVAKSKTGE
eukprot:6047705-Alexandrium_andersonii.AAC.1